MAAKKRETSCSVCEERRKEKARKATARAVGRRLLASLEQHPADTFDEYGLDWTDSTREDIMEALFRASLYLDDAVEDRNAQKVYEGAVAIATFVLATLDRPCTCGHCVARRETITREEEVN
jgi:hypothetical protein